MKLYVEKIVTVKFPNSEEARNAKNKLRRNGIHAYLSSSKEFGKYPGAEKWRAAHTIVNVVDPYHELGDTMEMIKRVLEK